MTSKNLIKAGQSGFGVGVCPDDCITQLELQKLEGTDVIGSSNYGNYTTKNGSVMVFVPAFVYRGNETTLQISYDVALEGNEGWILHRAFVNNGKKLRGFLVDKYLCSPTDDNRSVQSVKNADPITLSLKGSKCIDNPQCIGQVQDAYVLAKTRGEKYCVVSCFAYSALRMLSLAHAQASNSAENCAWWDATHCFVKGNTKYLGDAYDKEVKYTECEGFPSKRGKTGSGTPFAKTTHNGQDCGVADISGCITEVGIGVAQNSDMNDRNLYVFKPEKNLEDITVETVLQCDLYYDSVPCTHFKNMSGAWTEGASQFSKESVDMDWALAGVYPLEVDMQKRPVKYLQGEYIPAGVASKYTRCVFTIGGTFMEGTRCGLWYTSNKSHNNGSLTTTGFRCMLLVE